MLTAVYIGNFKAFSESQRIPIRPLTLIYGANSSGKSSILHALILACHAMETGDLTALQRKTHMNELFEEMEQQAKALEITK